MTIPSKQWPNLWWWVEKLSTVVHKNEEIFAVKKHLTGWWLTYPSEK
jgi:hypothetical protein